MYTLLLTLHFLRRFGSDWTTIRELQFKGLSIRCQRLQLMYPRCCTS